MVKAGYKQTEVGVIPEDWEVAQLNKFIGRLEAGVSVNSVADGKTAGLQKVLKTSCALAGKFDPNEAKEIAPRDIVRAKLNPQADTIIVSRMNTPDLVGECGFVNHTHPELFLPDRLWMTHHRKDVPHSTKWLAECLAYPPVSGRVKSVATGTSGSMKNLSKGAFLSSLVPAPTDREEQKTIACALSDVDGLIAGLEALIAKKRSLKTATMQQILTGRTRLSGFGEGVGMKQTELGEIPEDWDVAKIGQILKITTGSRNTQDRIDDGQYPFFVRSQTVERINSYSFDGEAVLTAGDGVGTGKIFHYIEGKFDYHQRVYLIHSFGEKVSGYFFFLFFREYFFDRIMAMTAKSSVDSVRSEMIKDMPIFLPKPNEQDAIARVFRDIEGELSALEERLSKTKALKQGMMQELLTGRTRLI